MIYVYSCICAATAFTLIKRSPTSLVNKRSYHVTAHGDCCTIRTGKITQSWVLVGSFKMFLSYPWMITWSPMTDRYVYFTGGSNNHQSGWISYCHQCQCLRTSKDRRRVSKIGHHPTPCFVQIWVALKKKNRLKSHLHHNPVPLKYTSYYPSWPTNRYNIPHTHIYVHRSIYIHTYIYIYYRSIHIYIVYIYT